MDIDPKTQSKRTWLQFSLRTLLIATLVVAAFLGGRIPVLRELESTRQKMTAADKQAEMAMMEAAVAREQAEIQRHIAEEQRAMARYQLQAANRLLEKQSQSTEPAP